MRLRKNIMERPEQTRSGFTLVEMLVSVALVLLMMSLFAQIFSMASNSVTTQRGISLNDQKARALTTLIRADIHHRTIRYPQPFYPGENSATSPTPFGTRAGYLYLSTNDPSSGLDDLLQFTISSEMLMEDTDSSAYFGRAQMLSDRVNGSATSLSVNPNQPEADDGSLIINSTGSSPAAEVCYFVRNGNLYRRVSLLRHPLPVAGQQLNEQPTTVRGKSYFSAADGMFWFDANGNGQEDADELSNDFWRYFDYSAYPSTSSAPGATFTGISALNNEFGGGGATLESLGNPRYRFGFNSVGTGAQAGLSREHTAPGGFFLGRFLHAETSASNFNWPQSKSHVDGDASTPLGTSGAGNPINIVDMPLTLNTTTGLVTEFSETVNGRGRGGPRRMEDLVLSNVHEMKIEIWDERLQKYTTPGHAEQARVRDLQGNSFMVPGDYHMERRYADSDAYGPEGQSLGVFDTWHPDIDRLVDGDKDHPPLIAYRYMPPQYPNGPTRPDPAGGATVSINEPDRQTRRADNRGYWQPNTEYGLGDVVFVPWEDGRTRPIDNTFQYDEISEPKFQIAYRCVGRQGSFQSSATPPTFSTSPGRRIREANGELEWESIDNRRPLSSIRMTLRFMDQTTNTQRTLSLILSLTDEK
jgi:prepilin-type N-terminal cleavage/methylation domain-containing protein